MAQIAHGHVIEVGHVPEIVLAHRTKLTGGGERLQVVQSITISSTHSLFDPLNGRASFMRPLLHTPAIVDHAVRQPVE